jgi:hypothetical protein
VNYSYDRVQAMKSAPVPSTLLLAHRGISDAGRELPWTLRLAQQFAGHDFSTVRIHSGPVAEQANTRLHTRAYTLGEHIAFAGGVDPELLVHELTHVLQQRRGAAADFGESAELIAEHAAFPGPTAETLGATNRLSASTGRPPPVVQCAPNQAGTTDPSYVVAWVRSHEVSAGTPGAAMDALSNAHGGNLNRYFYTGRYGWVDVRHFGAAASLAAGWGNVVAETLGIGNEAMQWATEWGSDYRSGFSPEDIPSNAAGAEFGDDYINSRTGESTADALERWMRDNYALPANDPGSRRASLPVSDPSERGGANRGSSNVSRTQSTASGKASEDRQSAEAVARRLNDPWAWAGMIGG